MNVTGVSDNSSRSVEQGDVEEEAWLDQFYNVVTYATIALGLPGNVLSATVWIRRHAAAVSGSPSAIYLASLAVNDLVWLVSAAVLLTFRHCCGYHDRDYALLRCFRHLAAVGSILEPLLVLSFSVVRLIAIRRPLQVRFITRFYHAMHCSAKRSLVIACRLSVRLLLCHIITLVDHDHAHRLKILQTNFVNN